MFDLLNNVCSTSLRRGLIGCCVSATSMLAFTAATQASPHRTSVTISASFGGAAACRPICEPPRRFDQAAYDRGVCAGGDRGFSAGYRDGLNGHRYDNCVTASFRHSSRAFEGGYRTAFASAYVSGFERGKCERPREVCVEVRRAPIHCEPVHVRRWSHGPSRHFEVGHRGRGHRGGRH